MRSNIFGIVILLVFGYTNTPGSDFNTEQEKPESIILEESVAEPMDIPVFSEDVNIVFDSIERINKENERKLQSVEKLKSEINSKTKTIKKIRQDINSNLEITKANLDEYLVNKRIYDSIQYHLRYEPTIDTLNLKDKCVDSLSCNQVKPGYFNYPLYLFHSITNNRIRLTQNIDSNGNW